jgi:hypothetical protein
VNRSEGIWAFLAWTLVGILVALSILGALSIGFLVLPLAIGAFVAAGNRARAWPEGLGLAAGAGVLVAALIFNGLAWLLVGSLLTAASVALFVWLSRRTTAPPPATAPYTAPRSAIRAWPWALLAAWLFLGIVPVARVEASLSSHRGPFPNSISTDHLISLLFGGSSGFSQQGGNGGLSIAQHQAIHQTWTIQPAGAEALALISVLAFIVVRVWTKRDELAISAAALLFLTALVVLALEIQAFVRDLRPALGGGIHLSFEPWYWLLVAAAAIVTIGGGGAFRRTRDRTPEHAAGVFTP